MHTAFGRRSEKYMHIQNEPRLCTVLLLFFLVISVFFFLYFSFLFFSSVFAAGPPGGECITYLLQTTETYQTNTDEKN